VPEGQTIYVPRDAASFVRSGYRIDYLSLWDFYPQTVHVEVVARLVFDRTANTAREV